MDPLGTASARVSYYLQLFAVSRVLGINADTPVRNQPTRPTDSDDFATFMHAYQDMVFSTAARLIGDDALAADVSQEVFLKAYGSFAKLRTSSTAGGWLKTVAIRLALNHLSRYRRRWRFFSELRADNAGEDAGELEFPVADTAAADIDSEQRAVIIDRAIQELPEHQRAPLVLYHFEDMPYIDIARQLQVSLAKVKTDIQRGRSALVKKLARSGIITGALDS